MKNAIQALQELATTSSNVRYPYSLPARSNPDLPENVKRPQMAILQRSSSHPPEVFGWDGTVYDSPAHQPHHPYHHHHHHLLHQPHLQQHHQHHTYQQSNQQCLPYQQQHTGGGTVYTHPPSSSPPQAHQQQQLQQPRYYHRPSVAGTADVAVQTDVSGVDVFERFVKAHRTLVLEWLNESDHVAVTVYDDETAASGRRTRNERSPSSSSSSCSSPPRQARAPAADTPAADTSVDAADGSPPAGRNDAPREWYTGANPLVATVSEDSGGGGGDSGGGDEDDGGGTGHESIEMTRMAPAGDATTTTSGAANASGPITTLKFHPFV